MCPCFLGNCNRILFIFSGYQTYISEGLDESIIKHSEPEGLDESIAEHLETEQSEREQWIVGENKRTYKSCSVCDYKSQYPTNVRRHERTHHTPDQLGGAHFLCSYCGKVYRSKSGLQLHQKSVHDKKIRFECRVCTKKFNTLRNYRGHMASHDSGLRERCPDCKSTFQTKRSMLRHRESCKNVQNKRRFICSFCGLECNSNDALREHKIRLHEGKVLHCSKCSKQFKWRSSLSYHMQRCAFGPQESPMK